MKSLIITNLPDIISEKDLFLLLHKITPGLRRITIADDPEVCGKTLNLAVVNYMSHEYTRQAFEKFKVQTQILGKTISAVWREPNFDILHELALETKVVYIKNISANTDTEKLRNIASAYGEIVKLKKFVDRAFIEFTTIESAQKMIEQCHEKRPDGLAWKVLPSKRLDEEKVKENPDKNSIFSKNFLEEEDQQNLLKFAFSGTLSEIDKELVQKASSIIQSAKTFQTETFENLKQRHEDLLITKNTITAPARSHSSYRDSRDSYGRDRERDRDRDRERERERDRDRERERDRDRNRDRDRERDRYKPRSGYDSQDSYNSGQPRYSKTERKYNQKQQYKEQHQYMGGPAMSNVNLQAGMIQQQQQLQQQQQMLGAGQVTGQNLAGDIALGYPLGMNPYDAYQRTNIPVQYGGNPYYAGQNPYAQWNTMMPQQMNPQGHLMGQQQFFVVNPNANNMNSMAGYNTVQNPAMGSMGTGNQSGTGKGYPQQGYQNQY